MDCPMRNELAGLPDEALLEILARAPFRTVCGSRCVAKAWRDIVNDPLNRRRLPQTLQGFFAMSNQMDNLEHFFIKYLSSPLPLDIDPCVSFLVKLPKTESVSFLDSCNGLLLFEHCPKSNPLDVLSYVVCNPATEHWGTVPVCAHCPPPEHISVESKTYLAFDPAVSPHFHLIQIWRGFDELTVHSFDELTVHTYSSETGVWSHSETDWNEQGELEGWRRRGVLDDGWDKRTFVNGLLHLIVSVSGRAQIVAVDVQGKTKRIIKPPKAAEGRICYDLGLCIGQSQGRLCCIGGDFDDDDDPYDVESAELSIWVLQDYDTQEWRMKDNVSYLIPFGTTAASWDFVAIHPDRNVVFFLQSLNRLIAYDMDYKEVTVVFMSSEDLEGTIVPYIPYFSPSPELTNKD